MFDQLVVLLSFVFAIALTHLLSCATDLILARKRVRFSGLYALWSGIAMTTIIVNWLSMWSMRSVQHWTAAGVVLLFFTAVVQYFTCSTMAMRVPEEGPVDMAAFFQSQRSVIFAAYGGLYVCAMAENYVFRAIDQAGPAAWIVENVVIAVSAIPLAVAAWARARWLQWAAGLLVFAMVLYFLATFTLPA